MLKNRLLLLTIFIVIKGFSQDNNAYVSQYLDGLVQRNILSAKDVQNYIITDTHVSRKSNVNHFYFRQSYNAIEIVGTESGLHVLSNGQIIASSNNFIASVEEKITARDQNSISPREAIMRIAQEMNYSGAGAIRESSYSSNLNRNQLYFTGGGISKSPIPAKQIYYARPFDKPVLAWEISIQETSGNNWYNFFVNAGTGEIIAKNNWKTTCSVANHNCESGEDKTITVSEFLAKKSSPARRLGATYNVFALPIENPFFGPRTLEVDPHNLIASPYGWHDTDGNEGAEFTVTRGNNVNAYEDGDNQGYQPDGGPDLIFDYPFNPVFSFSDQSEDAAITNLFYWSNAIHDILYLYGFDEESGNFQVNNYGGLGLGNDPVNAEAQDGSGSCNANFFSPPDGLSGIMQMYTCNSRDGDFDNQVIVHEYAHGLSIRLTGGGSNSDCLFNDEQMGEGWSDWYGSVLTMTAGDLPTDLQPVGNWLFGQDQDGPGIRDFPYTTDLSQDPRTYDYIKNTFGPHPLGSTWAAMLWELTWGLISEHGFDPDVYNGSGGNNIAIALVTEALKLQPCNPGFVDGRDAILAADMALYGGANQCIIWDAFAKRGLGFSTDQGSSNSRLDGTEAFDNLSTSLNIEEESFCFFESPVVLGGGTPIGGVYSGPGVTDNGDGSSFTFDPNAAGQGVHTITYTANSICTVSGVATDTIEVTDGQPDIICQDITISLDDSDTVSIIPEDIVANFLPGDGYTLDQTGTFNPEDISGSGSIISLSDDQVSTALPIGFDFTFYQDTYTTFYISSNGFITFDSGGDSGCCSGQNLPNSNTPNNLIAFAWDDLFPPGNGTIRYATLGTAPNRVLIVDVVDLPFCCDSNAQVTTQVKIFEGTNRIEIHSADVTGSPMTQGIENVDGTDALPVPGRNGESISVTNDVVAFIPNTGSFPDNCGLETTVTIDIDTFDCSNIGDNTVTATVTDSNGNTASCSAIVTVLPNSGAEFNLDTTVYCADEGLIVGLTGGTPVGGVYSGPGVTDDGNGTTFSFDPTLLGQGFYTISYETVNSCATLTAADTEIEVQSAIPDIQCQDITLALDLSGNATITPTEILLGVEASGSLYALNPFAANNNIALYNYNPSDDDISVNIDFLGSTQITQGFAMDKDPSSGEVYILAGLGGSSPRQLFNFDLEVANGGATLIEAIASVTGNTNPQSMAFGADGILYFVFSNGEVNAYNIDNQIMSPLSSLPSNGAVGLTYDYDNNRLIHATGSGLVNITAIDIGTGVTTPLFSVSPGCGAQAIEYVGDKLIASSTGGCNKVYTIDLNTQQVTDLLNPSNTFSSIKDFMYVGGLPVDNCNGQALSFTLDQDSFTCADIGDNLVTVTATDAQGNQTSCSATVTVTLPESSEVTFELNPNIFCEDEGVLSGLTGGTPSGGVYSGPGVTDDGNGTTFSFNPSAVGVGNYTITYSLDSCGTLITADAEVEIQSAIPDIVCQDINVALDETGNASISAIDILLDGNTTGSLFVLDPFNSSNNLASYDYDPFGDTITVADSFIGSTQLNRNFAIDRNPVTGTIYILSGTGASAPRQLFSFDLDTANGGAILIGTIESVTGNANPQAMTFGGDSTLYFVFSSGEVNAYDLNTQTMSAFSNLPSNGAVGLTYDYDNNRLIHSVGTGTVTLSGIDVATGGVTTLFNVIPGCGAQAIEYVGDKLVASSTGGCNKIYTIDMNTQQVSDLLSPSGTFSSIKDLLFIGGLPVDNCNGQALSFTLDQNNFTCADIGDNTVTVTATDAQGNQSSCTAVVTVIDDMAPELSCVENLNVILDGSGSASISENNLIISATDNCSTSLVYNISQTEFDCNDLMSDVSGDLITNGSFEDGLSNWFSTIENGNDGSGAGSCELKWRIDSNSQNICCCVDDVFPTNGGQAAFTSFDNGVPNTIYKLEQSINIPANVDSVELFFDWAGEFDLGAASQDRVFNVELYDSSGILIDVVYNYQIPAFTATSVNESVNLDITSSVIAYSGQAISVAFTAIVPESFSGPAKAMVDNVSMIANGTGNQVLVTLEATDAFGNSSTCQTLVQVLDPDENCSLSNETFDENSINIYPNPFTDAITVSWSNQALNDLEIFDVTGKLVHTKSLKGILTEVSIPTSGLSNGFYFIRITSDYGAHIKQLVKR